VSLGTGLGGAVRSRKTPSGFILSGRGDEIEFSVEVDEVNYSQFSVKRKNIRLATKKNCEFIFIILRFLLLGHDRIKYIYFFSLSSSDDQQLIV
jgi:hypothetical protein